MSGPFPDVLAPLTLPAAWMYERLIEARNRRYDRGTSVERLPVPVISIGNITTGGTGKTPVVMWIVKFLRERGHQPAIAMRGYGASPGHSSDEALEYAEALPDTPVLVNPDRLAASRAHLKASPQTDCIILDDGFQHRRLHRDIDLVLLDASANTFNQRMIPAGHLREPLHNLARADAVIVTRASGFDEVVRSQIERHHGRPPLAWTRHHWKAVRIISPKSRTDDASGHIPTTESTEPPDTLKGRRLITLLGVGNPSSIIAQLEAAGASVAANIPAGDHERFSRAKLEVARGLCDGVPDGALVMTQKDWVRARDLINWRNWPVPIIIPQLEIDVLQGRDKLEELILQPLAA